MEDTVETVEHPGVVCKIEGPRIWVRIETRTACGNCHSRSYCDMSGMSEKIVEVLPARIHTNYSIGQTVNIILRKSMGYKALLLGYIMPFLLLIMVLFTVQTVTGSQFWSAISSVAILVPYYLVLYYFRKSIGESFRFYIKD